MIKSLNAPDRRIKMLNLSISCSQQEKKEDECEPLPRCDTAYGGFRIINTNEAPNLIVSVPNSLIELIPNVSGIFGKTPSFSVGYLPPSVSGGQGPALINKRAGTYNVNFNANVLGITGNGSLYAGIYVNNVLVTGYENFVNIFPGGYDNFSINGQIILKAKSVVEVKFYSSVSSLYVAFNELSLNISAA